MTTPTEVKAPASADAAPKVAPVTPAAEAPAAKPEDKKPIDAPAAAVASAEPIVLIGRRAEDVGKDVRVAAYRGEGETVIVANAADLSTSPFSETATVLERSSTTVQTIASVEFEALSKVGDCSNAECRADLRTTSEIAETLKPGDHVNCVLCDHAHVIGADKALAAAPAVEIAGKSDDEDDEQDEGEDDDQQEGDDDEAEVEASDEDEDEDEDEDDDSDEDEEEDEEASAISESEIASVVSMVDQILANDKAETAAAAESVDRYRVDLTAMTDFEPANVVATMIRPGLIALFAVDKETAATVHLGTLDAAKASKENADIYKAPTAAALQTIAHGFTAAIEQADSLDSFGFVSVVREIDLPSIVAEQAAAKTREAEVASTKTAETAIADYDQSIAVAAAGMNKGLYDNPLATAIGDQLRKRGVANSASLAMTIVTASADAYIKTMLTKARDLAKRPAGERNAIASTIIEAKATVVESTEPETAGVVSSAALSGLVVDEIAATAAAPPMEQPQPAKRASFFGKRLFA